MSTLLLLIDGSSDVARLLGLDQEEDPEVVVGLARRAGLERRRCGSVACGSERLSVMLGCGAGYGTCRRRFRRSQPRQNPLAKRRQIEVPGEGRCKIDTAEDGVDGQNAAH
jgi:hypothetical protein